MTGPRYTCVPGEPPTLSEVYVDRLVKALWDEPIRWRQPIVSSDALALEAVRLAGLQAPFLRPIFLSKSDGVFTSAIEEFRDAKLKAMGLPKSPAQELTEMLEDSLYGREEARAWRADHAAARAAGQRAVVRYAHEVRGR